MDYFGQNLKTLRKRMGLTQQELAEKFGVRKTTISNYETSVSSPPKNGLVEIANFFGVSLDELLSVVEDAEKKLDDVQKMTNSYNKIIKMIFK